MNIIFLVLLLAALIGETVLFVLFFVEKHSVKRRFKAMNDYISACTSNLERHIDSLGYEYSNIFSTDAAEFRKRCDTLQAKVEDIEYALSDCNSQHKEALAEQEKKMEEMLMQLKLDFTEAQQAANKVNDFASSLANIFDYDPIQAIQNGRKKEAH